MLDTARGQKQQQRAKAAAASPEKIQPVGHGPFGPIFDQFRHDAKGAIAYLRKIQTGEAIAALHHPAVGDIDLVWGVAGDNRNHGIGLAKLIRWHPEATVDLQGFIAKMKVINSSNSKQTVLRDGAKRAVVRLDWGRRSKRWLLTAFDKDESGRAASK
jgi:hypothetical protein